MRWILDLDILLLVAGIARKHGIMPKSFLGHPQYFPPPKKIHFLLRTRDFSRKRVCGFSNRRLQENIFNCANLFWGGNLIIPPHLTPQIQCLPVTTHQSYNTCCMWAGGTFFPSCAVVSVFWFLAGNRFWCYLLTYLEYNTVVALC
jgi:hypothetical protein